MNKYFIILALILNSLLGASQTSEVFMGETVNVRNADDKKTGVWVVLSADGKLEEKGNYVENKKEGIWKGFYASGKLKHEITYLNNRPDGLAKFYYEDGKVSEEGVWKINKWVGEYKYYHENGNLAYDWKYNESGRRTGEQKYYYDDGALMIKGDWDDGKKKGVLTELYQDGSIKSEMNFVEGKVDVNSIKEFQLAEKPAAKQTAPTLQKVEPAKNTQNNQSQFTKTGYYKTFNEFKKIDREGDFVNGKLINGKRYFYNDNGDLTRTLVYKDGKIAETIDSNP